MSELFNPLFIVVMLFAFYMAFNIGSNDLANAMASSVGAKAIKHKQAVVLGAVFAFAGAVFVGSHVVETIRKGIIDPELIENATVLAVGALSALLGASLWVTTATYKELPISTTHSIVGGMLGFGIVAYGPSIVSWGTVGKIVLSWILSPMLGGLLGYTMFHVISRSVLNRKDPVHATRFVGPALVGVTFMIIAMSLFFKTPFGKTYEISDPEALAYAAIVAVMAGAIGHRYVAMRVLNKVTGDEDLKEQHELVNRVFKRLQIVTACYVAFALGANDVANSIGPASAAYAALVTGDVSSEVAVPMALLFIGGLGIVVGMTTWGYKVIRTIGHKITALNSTRGFAIDFGGASSVLIASKFGMPVSTTHAVVGAVIGVGLARGVAAIDLRVIRSIIISWLVTVPIAAVTAAAEPVAEGQPHGKTNSRIV